MKIEDGKTLYTRKEVISRSKMNKVQRLKEGDVCKFYMSYDNDPDTFEERWGVVLEEEDSRLEVLILEGTDDNNTANYPYCTMDFSLLEGFTKKTKIRLDQALIVPYKLITSYQGHLKYIDFKKLENSLEKQEMKTRPV